MTNQRTIQTSEGTRAVLQALTETAKTLDDWTPIELVEAAIEEGILEITWDSDFLRTVDLAQDMQMDGPRTVLIRSLKPLNNSPVDADGNPPHHDDHDENPCADGHTWHDGDAENGPLLGGPECLYCYETAGATL